jgi:predicted O-methyltransferase YrrM
MDDKVAKVLDFYHRRIEEEDRRRDDPPAPGDTGSWLDRRLLAVGPDTGRFINLVAGSLHAPNILEIGTSYGYSGIWLAEAARRSGGRVTTLELQDYKSKYARERAAEAGLAEYIEYRVGDAVSLIGDLKFKIDFVLLDLWKDLYIPCLEAFYPKLNPGAIIVADNMLHPGGELMQRYADAVRAKPGITSVLLPVGQGIEVSCYQPR